MQRCTSVLFCTGKAVFSVVLPLLACVLVVMLGACQSQPGEDLSQITLNLDFRRGDSLMWEAARAIHRQPETDPYRFYREHLQSERDFWYEMIGLARLSGGRRPDPGTIDTLVAGHLLPLLADSAVFALLDTVQQHFPPTTDFESRISPPLKRLVKAFPDLELPAFRTHVNGYIPGGDMRSADQVLPTRHYFSFGLHFFLGEKFPWYPLNIAQYLRRRFHPDYLPVAMVESIAEGMVPQVDREGQLRLLDGVIRAGIKQYFMKSLLPGTPDSLLFFYTADQMDWAQYYEARIYKELIPHFYSGDYRQFIEYLGEKPFTTSLSRESAPRIGVFCGFQIVGAFMARNPEMTLADLVAITDYEMIFREARYKPET